MAAFKPTQMKLGRGEGVEARTSQIEFAAPKATKGKTLLTRKEEREIEKKKAAKGKRAYGLEAYGVEKAGQPGLMKFFERRGGRGKMRRGVREKSRKKCVSPVHIKGHCRRGCTIKVVPHTRSCPIRR